MPKSLALSANLPRGHCLHPIMRTGCISYHTKGARIAPAKRSQLSNKTTAMNLLWLKSNGEISLWVSQKQLLRLSKPFPSMSICEFFPSQDMDSCRYTLSEIQDVDTQFYLQFKNQILRRMLIRQPTSRLCEQNSTEPSTRSLRRPPKSRSSHHPLQKLTTPLPDPGNSHPQDPALHPVSVPASNTTVSCTLGSDWRLPLHFC